MSIVGLAIQLIAGVWGGNAAASVLKDYSLGYLGNTIAGALGGLVVGRALEALVPALSVAASGGHSVSWIIGQLIGAGLGGATLTIIFGVIKNLLARSREDDRL